MEFQKSVRMFNNMDKSLKEEIFYYVYGLYKQSLFGDNIAVKPYWFNFKSLNKWKSWKKEFGKTKDDAKLDYINVIFALIQNMIFK